MEQRLALFILTCVGINGFRLAMTVSLFIMMIYQIVFTSHELNNAEARYRLQQAEASNENKNNRTVFHKFAIDIDLCNNIVHILSFRKFFFFTNNIIHLLNHVRILFYPILEA